MSNKKFLAKLCLTSFLFGGNCNANPPKIASIVWGNVGKQNSVPSNDISMQSVDEKSNLLNSNIDVSPIQTLKGLKYIVLEITNTNDRHSVLAKLHTIVDKGPLGIEGKPEYKELSAVNGYDDDNKYDCCICFDKMLNAESKVCVKLSVGNEKNCNHLFHSDCICSWFSERGLTCPIDRMETKKIYFLLEKDERENEKIDGVANKFANEIAKKIGGSLTENVELKEFRKNLPKKKCKRRLKLVSVIAIFVLFLAFILVHLFGSDKPAVAEPKKSLPEEEKIRCGHREFLNIFVDISEALYNMSLLRSERKDEEFLKLERIMESENITHASPTDPRLSEVDFGILSGHSYRVEADIKRLGDIFIRYRYPKEFVTDFFSKNITAIINSCDHSSEHCLVESFFAELEKHGIAEKCFNYTKFVEGEENRSAAEPQE